MDPKIISVVFSTSYTEYAFLCYDEVKLGDTVVVDTKNGPALGQVSSVSGDNRKATKEVIAVVDMTAFEERRKKAEKIKALRQKMDEKIKKMQDLALYELMAKQDPELKDMLDELKSLV